jgi:radical SAM superfamily enzyme YgiQ (UPF0313 family)
MNLKILLVSVNTCSSPYPVFPIGLAHVAGALLRAGHDVEILDCNQNGKQLETAVTSFNPSYVGLSLRNIDDIQIRNTKYFADDLSSLAHRLREVTDVPVIIGGSGYSLFPKELLAASGADFGIQGEGDVSFVNLIEALHLKKPVTAIPGLVYRAGGVINANPQAAADPALIAPAFHPAGLADFYVSKSTILNVQTQRGCSSACCYCTYPLIEGSSVRSRDMKDVCDEIETIKRSGGCKYFFIVDSVFNSSEEHVRAFCEELIGRSLGLSWGCFLRPHGLSQKLMDLMARSGLTHIEFGSDSFCDSVLDKYGKRFTFTDIESASRFARNSGVRHAHFLIVGGPGETLATMREGFENSRRLKKTVHFPFVGMRIYPGTPLWRRALSEGSIDTGTDLLHPRFYIAPGLTEEGVFSTLSEFSRESPNWIVGELPLEKTRVIEGLRQKGVQGPLWEFLIR